MQKINPNSDKQFILRQKNKIKTNDSNICIQFNPPQKKFAD